LTRQYWMKNFNIKKIIGAGLLVGTLDISAAFVHYFLRTGNNPIAVLYFIASGVFGQDAFSDNKMMAVAGLIFHYCIAMTFTILFFALVRKFPLLTQHRMLTGTAYGIFIWIIMALIVLPLSGIPKHPLTLSNSLIAISILIVCIGLPLSFMARRFGSR